MMMSTRQLETSAIKRPRLDVAKINNLSENAGHCVHSNGRKGFQVTHAPQVRGSGKRKQVNFSTLGRKGDPRMHMAMLARLKKPSMSLQDALEQGGFAFVKNRNGEMIDTDKVQLRQRKNQLSRRLRLHRNQAKEAIRAGEGTEHFNGEARNDLFPQDRKGSDDAGNVLATLDVKTETCTETPALMNNSPSNKNDSTSSDKDVKIDGMVVSKGTALHNSINQPQHTQMQQSSSLRNRSGVDWGKMESALELFRIEASSLLKSCMLKAGFSQIDTDECDESYLAFSEVALGKELERLSRIRHRMGHRASSGSAPQANINDTALLNSVHGSNGVNMNGSTSSHTVPCSHQGHGIDANSNQLPWQTNERLLPKANEDLNQSHNHNLDHMHKNHQNDFILNGAPFQKILSPTDHQSHSHQSHSDGCIYTRHRHFLDGKCGHQAIIHKPADGAPHVDFIVDGKVECYQNIPLKSACWPSRFKNTELSLTDNQEVSKNHEKCDSSCRDVKAPKLLSIDELNFDGEEWFRDFESESAGAGTAAALDSFMKLSGLDNYP